jgi:hypothetical protein
MFDLTQRTKLLRSELFSSVTIILKNTIEIAKYSADFRSQCYMYDGAQQNSQLPPHGNAAYFNLRTYHACQRRLPATMLQH